MIGESDGIPKTGDEWRIDLLVTFIAGGRRGGTCVTDANCDGVDETDVRTIQQRLEFELTDCHLVCDCVQLTDAGASANDPACVLVTTTTLDEEICAMGEGTVTPFQITGTVTCIGDDCTTAVTNFAELTCEDPDLIEGSPNGASFYVTCGEGGVGDGDFCTQTQGGWGSTPHGNNPGACLHEWFATVFPSGLVIGDQNGPDGDMCWAILLTDAQAVTDFLPTGGTPAVLTGDLTDPLVSSAGVFAGQLVAATINAAFSQYNADHGEGSLTCGGGRTFPGGLGDLLLVGGCGGIDPLLDGISVNDLLAMANCVIGSDSGACGACGVPGGITISDISDALAAVNQNYVDCDTDNGCLE